MDCMTHAGRGPVAGAPEAAGASALFVLEPRGPSHHLARTDPRYWNQIGPFGGWLAGLAQSAMARHAPAGMSPRSIALNFLAALPAGPVHIEVQLLRRQRRVAALRALLRAEDGAAPAVTAEAVFGLGRPAPPAASPPAPTLPDVHTLPRCHALDGLAAFVRQFDYRIAHGWPFEAGRCARSGGWVRPATATAVDVPLLLMLADAWFPPGWAARRGPVPVSTVSMQVVFHATAGPAGAMAPGDGYFAACFEEDARSEGFGIERGQLWWPDGRLALTTQQLTWVGDEAAPERP